LVAGLVAFGAADNCPGEPGLSNLQETGRACLASERAVLEHIRDMNALLLPEQ